MQTAALTDTAMPTDNRPDSNNADNPGVTRPSGRFKAFAIHLGISTAIFAVLAYLVFFQWYPDFLFTLDGGREGIRLIVFVDMVLGPLLTLIVFKAGKPGLKFDLTLIGLVQAVCLAAGVYIVYTEHPLAIVYADGQFSTINQYGYEDAGMDPPDLRHIDGVPKWVLVEIPQEMNAQSDFRGELYRANRLVETAVEAYVPFSVEHPLFLNDAEDLESVLRNDEKTGALSNFLAEHGGTAEDYRFYPLITRYAFTYLAFTRDPTPQMVGVLHTRSKF